MTRSAFLAAATGALLAGTAAAQTTGYSLAEASLFTMKFCMDPCDCPYHEERGPVTGSFSLFLRTSNDVFEEYAVIGLDAGATVGGPDRALPVAGYGTYTLIHTTAEHRMTLDLLVDGLPYTFDSGRVPLRPGTHEPLPGGASSITLVSQIDPCTQYVLALDVLRNPEVCYANCDGSFEVPILNIADFGCFLRRFAAGDPAANCDGSMAPPVLNTADFTCFLTHFAAGCETIK